MKLVNKIVMATNTDIELVNFAGELELKHDTEDSSWTIFNSGEEEATFYNEEEANEELIKTAIDSDLVVTGYGTHSGRKFWQLPEELQNEVIKMASK